ncbi:MAG: hypothetical protein M1379_00290 [Firmicutes bacterium]|nr:hypothetical protein [Bacillota bacterium]
MQLRTILETYPVEVLEKIAANKISDIAHLKLPSQALIQELSEILCSRSYISNVLSLRQPPSYTIVSTLLEQEDYAYDVLSLKPKVLAETGVLLTKAASKSIFQAKKGYDLYLTMLKAAWELDNSVDRSEANLLATLRNELGISYQEHAILEHHPDMAPFWNGANIFERERNYLMAKGILLTFEGRYVLSEDMVPFIKDVWGIEMDSADYRRFLSYLTVQQLEAMLKQFNFPSSGDKEIKIGTLIRNFILPSSVMKQLSLEELREIARDTKSRVSGTKDELVANLLSMFDSHADFKQQVVETPREIPIEPKSLEERFFHILFANLSNEDLYDIASRLTGLHLSGTKQKRVDEFWASPYSERTLLLKLPNESLRAFCEKSGIPKNGDKKQLVERLINKYAHFDAIVEKNLETSRLGQLVKADEADVRKDLPQLEFVERDFHFLSADERIVLSAIIELKSLSEEELDRLASRYDLNWVLTKACMAELIEKLKQNQKDVIKMRSVGDKNIYEYRAA